MNDDKRIIGYQAITNRHTGEILTDPAPFFEADWPYHDVAVDQPLLRYMDFWKFEDLFETQSLYFCRADRFPDPLEGTLSVEGVHGTSASDIAFHNSAKIAPTCYADLAAYRNIARAVTFVNCWHINNDEERRMWDTYTTSSDSVLIISSGGLIKSALRHPVVMSAVKYVDKATPRTEFDGRSLFFYKDTQFEYEHEYRLLVDLHHLDGAIRDDHSDDFSRRIPVDLSTLVYAIQPHPQAAADTHARIAALVAEYLPNAAQCL